MAYHSRGVGVIWWCGAPLHFLSFSLSLNCHNIVKGVSYRTHTSFIYWTATERKFDHWTRGGFMEELKRELYKLIDKLGENQLRYLIVFIKKRFGV